MASTDFFLGGVVDPSTGDRTGTDIAYDAADLTTHGVIVGMTGSGKTGLGVIYLEEALRNDIPTLVIDPKGDMTNLLLTFPDLAPADFEPWLDPAEVRKSDGTASELAAAKAELWRNGLDSWDLGGADIAALRDTVGFTIYTPGSSSGVPINIVGSLANPGLDWDTSAEALREEIQGFASGLLGLVGIEADPISSREHILISNLVEHAWRAGQDLDLATLLGHIQRPPMRKLGVFEVDSFYPEKDRTALAMQLNGLLASASFAEWVSGPPLDVGAMLWDPDGKPQSAIIYLAHLSDEERQFIVTLVLSKVITWMRSQPGTGDLRALVYMDEVFGFAPPTATPPAKLPILTLMKQGRAFGVGMLLSTQNPVDLDYKAMSNAGTWCVGRLQTERDKARILEALQSATGGTDITVLDATISALGERQFLLHNTHAPAPEQFMTRWAMSYLAGPLTRQQIGTLTADHPAQSSSPSPGPTPRDEPFPTDHSQHVDTARSTPDEGMTLPDDETPVMPSVADDTTVRWLAPSAPWADSVGASPGSQTHAANLAVRVNLIYDDRTAGVDHTDEWEAIVPIGDEGARTDEAQHVDYDDRDLLDQPPADVVYQLTRAPIGTRTFFTDAARALTKHIYRSETLTILKNPSLKLYSRPDEDPAAFRERCDAAAQEHADAETAKLRDRYAARIKTATDQFESADRRVRELESSVAESRQSELLSGAETLLGILTGSKSTRSATGSLRQRQANMVKEERLQTAQGKAMSEWEDIAELEAELTAELEEINDRWEILVDETEELEIRLEKSDISVVDTALLWIPVD